MKRFFNVMECFRVIFLNELRCNIFKRCISKLLGFKDVKNQFTTEYSNTLVSCYTYDK